MEIALHPYITSKTVKQLVTSPICHIVSSTFEPAYTRSGSSRGILYTTPDTCDSERVVTFIAVLPWVGFKECGQPEDGLLVRAQHLNSALKKAGAAGQQGLHGLRRERLRVGPAIPSATQPRLWASAQHCVVRIVVHLNRPLCFNISHLCR